MAMSFDDVSVSTCPGCWCTAEDTRIVSSASLLVLVCGSFPVCEIPVVLRIRTMSSSESSDVMASYVKCQTVAKQPR